MPILFQHIKIALLAGVVITIGLLGANLIDVDHVWGNKLAPQDAVKCASYLTTEKFKQDPNCACPSGTNLAESNCRGIFHNVWFLVFMIALTLGIAIHLYLDGIFTG